MKRKNKYYLKRLLDYLGGKLTEKERNSMERDMQRDPFLEDAMEGLSGLSEEEIRQDIDFLNRQINQKTARKSKFMLYRIAAALVLLVTVSTLIISLYYYLPAFQGKPELAVSSEREEKETEFEEDTFATGKPEIFEDVNDILARPVLAPAPVKKAEFAASEEEIDRKELDIAKTEIEPEIKTVVTEHVPAASRQLQPIAAGVDAGKVSEIDENRITGIVISSDDGLALPGVSIVIKGTTLGVVTDFEGKFSMLLPEKKDATLVASFVGMRTQEIQPGTSKELEVVLEPDLLALDEVVVVGYGVSKRSSVTGAMQEVSVESLINNRDYKPAGPVGGNRQFGSYIQSKLRFPEQSDIKRAVVILSFIVDSKGRPKNISVLSSPGKDFSDEAIRLLIEGPDWYPATLADEYIEVVSQIRIVMKK